MELSDIKFILDIESTRTLNKYLDNGWILVNTYTKSYDPTIAPNDLTMHYVIGATSNIDYSKEKSDLHGKANNIDIISI
ncbi:hypothetical protein [Clostridium sporogenes]|uniref:hypothetical protein n=1 Tax=Clostridium sporogenes TaxID=1509 RepID=UPI0005EF0410|nr:hypothetical protein [Clostridium sporogenes]